MTTEVTNERLADRLNYVVGNPSAWPEGFNDSVSELIREAVAALRSRSPSPTGNNREVVTDVAARLRAACVGHPHALIVWPHSVLHEGADRIEALAASLEAVERERDALRTENARLERVTTRFPDLMARIVAQKDAPYSERAARLHAALIALTDSIHQYQWVADAKAYFGEMTVRSVAGDNGRGMGRQAIASVPSHLTGVAEFIAAANPDTIAHLLGEVAALTAERDALKGVLGAIARRVIAGGEEQ